MKVFPKRITHILVIALLISGLFSTIILNMTYSKLVNEAEVLQKQLIKLSRSNEEMQIKIAKYQNYSSLENIARTRLKMISPKKVEFIIINPKMQGRSSKQAVKRIEKTND